jgi:ferredoxin
MSRRVNIDLEECIGCGSCHDICPEVFDLDEEIEKARVIKPKGGPENLVEEAMGACPMQCIYWED